MDSVRVRRRLTPFEPEPEAMEVGGMAVFLGTRRLHARARQCK